MQKKFLGALGMALVLMTGTMAMPVQVCAKDYQDREAILDTGFVLDTDYTLPLGQSLGRYFHDGKLLLYHGFLRSG